MRHFCAILSLLILICLGGCASLSGQNTVRAKEIAASVTQQYQTDMTTKIGGMPVTASLSKASPEAWEITVNSPPTLAGYTYRVTGDGVQCSYRELSFTWESDSALQTAPLLRVATALADALLLEPGELPAEAKGAWKIDRTNSMVPCTLTIDDATGLPAKLLLDSGNMEITFENFTFLG